MPHARPRFFWGTLALTLALVLGLGIRNVIWPSDCVRVTIRRVPKEAVGLYPIAGDARGTRALQLYDWKVVWCTNPPYVGPMGWARQIHIE
jgi:hypothetical protein